MDIISAIFGKTSQIIEAFIWYRLMTNMLERKYSKKVYVIAAASIFVLVLIKGVVFKHPFMGNLRGYGSLIIIIYTFISGMILFKNPFFEKLIWWGLYYAGIMIMELLMVFFLNTIIGISIQEVQTNRLLNDSVSIIIKILTLSVFEFFISRRKGRLQIKVSSYKNLGILIVFNVVLLLGCVIVFFNANTVGFDMNNVIQIFFVVALLTAFVTSSLVFKMEKESRKELQTKLKLQQIEMELKLNKDMVNVTENLRKLRHDMNNHIGLIKNLVYSQRYKELKEYIDEIYLDVAVANEYIVSENTALSVLLNAKRTKAKDLNIDFQSIVATSDIRMQDKDICVLFGNLLDNALEAAEKAENKRFIDFSIQQTPSGCIIQCENSVGKKPEMKKGKFISSKENSYLHGIGTENIQDIVTKYSGDIKFDFDDEVFSVRIVMPLKEELK
jgi:two-component system sensor histidine kinase AgrC